MTNEAEDAPPGVWRLTPAERFRQTPRPLDYVRIRLHADFVTRPDGERVADGQATYVRDLLNDERQELEIELADARVDGKPEDGPEVAEIRQNLYHLNRAIKDISNGMIELLGSRENG